MFLVSIAIGILAGFLASKIMKQSYGTLFLLVLGIVGGVIGNLIFMILDIHINNFLGSLIMSVAGAILLLWLVSVYKKVRNKFT